MATIRLHITSRRGVSVAAATATVLLAVAPAYAQGEEPGASAVNQYVETLPPISSVGQYVEAVPTGAGPSVPPATATAPSGRGDEGKRISGVLERIAKSSSYGAPTPGPTGAADAPASRVPDATATTSISASLRSALGALGTASDTRLLGLLAVVLVTTVVAIGLATRRGPT